MEVTANKMGTMAWYEASDGRLTRTETQELARHVAALKAEVLFDEIRHRLGLLSPRAMDIEALAPPDTALVRDADEFGHEIYNDVLWGHCLRTYYFGALVAAHDEIEFDREVFYAAAVCHDAGLAPQAVGHLSTCCFAYTGGRLTRERLLLRGHPEAIVGRIADAISTHLNLFVPLSHYPAESTLTAVGAVCDVMGAYVRRISPETLEQVVRRYPRTGMMEFMAQATSVDHPAQSRPSLLLDMNALDHGDIHPIEATLHDHEPAAQLAKASG